ncbi:hypothetical protein VTP01DRAFT_3350 [Rhizomucor pusillus]|uniref:uncharacterized protein n=1 Tax=Rhizomucor pusillus TaxID=4840 RepID=UPI0037420FCE
MSSTKGSDAVTAEDSEDDFQTPIVPRKRTLKKPERQTAGTSDSSTIKRSKDKDAIAAQETGNDCQVIYQWRFVGNAISKSVREARHHCKRITTHAYALARLIFLSEIHATKPGERFPMENWLETDFFAEVRLSLTLRTVKSSITDGTTRYRGLIDRHVKNYLKQSGFSRKALTNSQQIARYEGSRICTAYLNSIKNCFGMTEQSKSNEEIKEAIYKQVTKPAHDVKQAFITGNARGSLSSEKQKPVVAGIS